MSSEKPKGGDMEMEFIEMKNATVTESYDKERNLDSIEDTKPGPFVWLCATATAIGGSLFGCEYSIVLAVVGHD
jgi:SP family myo-inositol transporter-like MFS transporter 13